MNATFFKIQNQVDLDIEFAINITNTIVTPHIKALALCSIGIEVAKIDTRRSNEFFKDVVNITKTLGYQYIDIAFEIIRKVFRVNSLQALTMREEVIEKVYKLTDLNERTTLLIAIAENLLVAIYN